MIGTGGAGRRARRVFARNAMQGEREGSGRIESGTDRDGRRRARRVFARNAMQGEQSGRSGYDSGAMYRARRVFGTV